MGTLILCVLFSLERLRDGNGKITWVPKMDCISPWLLKLLTDHSAVRGGLKLLEVANTGGKCHAGVLLRSAYTSGTAKGRGSSILDVLCGHALSGFGTRTKAPGIWDDRNNSVSKHRVLTSLDTIATVCYILDDLTTSIKDSVSRDDTGGSSSQDLIADAVITSDLFVLARAFSNDLEAQFAENDFVLDLTVVQSWGITSAKGLCDALRSGSLPVADLIAVLSAQKLWVKDGSPSVDALQEMWDTDSQTIFVKWCGPFVCATAESMVAFIYVFLTVQLQSGSWVGNEFLGLAKSALEKYGNLKVRDFVYEEQEDELGHVGSYALMDHKFIDCFHPFHAGTSNSSSSSSSRSSSSRSSTTVTCTEAPQETTACFCHTGLNHYEPLLIRPRQYDPNDMPSLVLADPKGVPAFVKDDFGFMTGWSLWTTRARSVKYDNVASAWDDAEIAEAVQRSKKQR